MDGTAPGDFTPHPPPTRVWLDDPNPIFRMGLAASLRDSGFVVVGESAGFVPPPDLGNVDVLVFDLGEPGLGVGSRFPQLSRRYRRSTRLVGLVPGGDAERVNRSQCTVLSRSELTPESFRRCLAAVVTGAAPAGSAGAAGPGRRCGSAPGSGGVHERSFLQRLRRVAVRKGALFVVAASMLAGAFGPSDRAEGLSGTPAVAAAPAAETAPVESDGDAATGVAVWADPADPSASLVVGTDRRGGLEVYNLKGKRLARLPHPPGALNDVDLRAGFPLGGELVTLVGAAGRMMSFFRLDAGPRLREVSAHGFRSRDADAGFCLYRSAASGYFYAFVVESDGDITQYELLDRGGFVDARPVRGWPLGSPAAGCVADDETGRLFVSEKRSGIWRYNAEPGGSPLSRKRVDRSGRGHLVADVGGLALVLQPGRRGFLLASSRGDSTFAVYRRGRDHGWLGQRKVVDGPAADGCSDTRGIAAVAAYLGPAFPAGIFICQDGRNTRPGNAGRQNFKLVRLEEFLDTRSLPA